jgi:hypothetical protein
MQKAESVSETVEVQFNSGGDFYCVPSVTREGAIWLSVKTLPLPIGPEWKAPHTFGMALIRGRDYARQFTRAPLIPGAVRAVEASDPIIADWRDAAWWTPGLEEAWAECQGLCDAIAQHEKNLERERRAKR